MILAKTKKYMHKIYSMQKEVWNTKWVNECTTPVSEAVTEGRSQKHKIQGQVPED